MRAAARPDQGRRTAVNLSWKVRKALLPKRDSSCSSSGVSSAMASILSSMAMARLTAWGARVAHGKQEGQASKTWENGVRTMCGGPWEVLQQMGAFYRQKSSACAHARRRSSRNGGGKEAH